jgi:hypothetical protein
MRGVHGAFEGRRKKALSGSHREVETKRELDSMRRIDYWADVRGICEKTWNRIDEQKIKLASSINRSQSQILIIGIPHSAGRLFCRFASVRLTNAISGKLQ